MGIKSYKSFSNTITLKIIGDVNTVLDGIVDESNLNENVLEELKFALGAGSFSDCHCVGESLILNQIGYSCHLKNKGNYQVKNRVNDKAEFITDQLITDKGSFGLRSPFLMGLQLECQPKDLLDIDYPLGITLNELFEEMGKGLLAYAFVAWFSFKELACSYIKKPPIFKENINEHFVRYWAKTEEYPEQNAYVFGVVIKEAGKQHFPPEILQKSFYINPQEKNQGVLLSHTHAALIDNSTSFLELKKDSYFYEKFDPNAVIGIRHVFTQSTVKQGFLALFDITKINH